MPTTARPDPSLDLSGFLAWHRRAWGDATMTAPGPPPPVTPPPPVPGPPATPPPVEDRTFTQDDVNRMAAREKDQGERAGRRKVAEDLGLDPDTFDPAAVKAALAAQDTARQATETAAETALRQAVAREAAATAREAAADARELAMRRAAALTAAGLALPADPVERAAALEQAARLLDITAADGDDAVRDKVDTLRGRLPGLFGTAVPPPPPRAPGGAPSGTPPRTPQAPAGDAFERGKARALGLPGGTAPATT